VAPCHTCSAPLHTTAAFVSLPPPHAPTAKHRSPPPASCRRRCRCEQWRSVVVAVGRLANVHGWCSCPGACRAEFNKRWLGRKSWSLPSQPLVQNARRGESAGAFACVDMHESLRTSCHSSRIYLNASFSCPSLPSLAPTQHSFSTTRFAPFPLHRQSCFHCVHVRFSSVHLLDSVGACFCIDSPMSRLPYSSLAH
jgi:hypothetical protein